MSSEFSFSFGSNPDEESKTPETSGEKKDAHNELASFFGGAPATPPATPGATPPGLVTPRPKNSPMAQSFSSQGVRRETDRSAELSLDMLLRKLLDNKSSDLHLTAGMPPMMRKHGEIKSMEGLPPLSGSQIQQIMFDIMEPEQQTAFQRTHDLDMSYEIPGRARFRVNVLQQRKQVGAVIRVIPNEILSLEQLGMPGHLSNFAHLPRGLVLVTGPTGSGKSTTLAAIIDAANRERHDHILTIEDPIEFVHQNKNSIVTQREVGVDTASFAEALRRALREDPDIILVGEMRDPETTQIAITAAETGHLVFGTLHTNSAASTLSRIVDQFPAGQQDQIRTQVASTLQGVISQTLLKTLDGKGRVAAMEILKGETSVTSLIRRGQVEQITSALEVGGAKGMQTLDQHLTELVKGFRVSIDVAISKASNPDAFVQRLGGTQQVERHRRMEQDYV